MKKNMFAVMVACLLMVGLGMACTGLDIEDNKITGGLNIYGQPDPVYIDDFCGVSMEFGATYVEAYNEWMWNKIYIRNNNVGGAQITIKDGQVTVFDRWIGFNAAECINIKGDDSYYHTGCPSDIWLDVNAHIKVFVTYYNNHEPFECPANGSVYDLDP